MNRKLLILCLLILSAVNSYSAVEFNGTNQYVKSAAAVTYGSNILTICFWIKWPSYADDDDLALESSANYNSNAATFIIDPNAGTVAQDIGTFAVGIRGSTGIRSETIPRPVYPIFHVAAVLDNSTTAGDVKIYINGIEQTTSVALNTKGGTTVFSAQILNLMSRNGASLFAAGTMDDFRIYNHELSASEIYSIYGSKKRFSITDGLLLWWKMDEGVDGTTVSDKSTSLIDFSGNGNHGNVKAAPVWRASDWISY